MTNRQSVGGKIFLVAASFILPIGVLLWLTVNGINGYIDFARKEIHGSEYQAALEQVLEAVLNQRSTFLACAQAGDAGCAAQSKQLAAKVEEGFAALKTAHSKYGVELEFTPAGLAKRGRQKFTPDQVEAHWREVTASSPAASGEGFSHVIQDVRGMITHAGDTSNLILDPDLDSYYLMDVTLLTLPQTQERMGRIGGMIAALPEGASPQARQRIGVEAALMKEADLDRAVASTNTSFNEDANFYGTSPTLKANLTAPLDKYARSSTALIELAQQVSQDGVVPRAQVAAADTAARSAAFAFWRAGKMELESLLERRVDAYRRQRASALAAAFTAIMLACALAAWLSRSITAPLKDLMRSLGPGATLLGNCVQRISETTASREPDPVQAEIICEELNAHCDSMRRAVFELARHVEGAAAKTREEVRA